MTNFYYSTGSKEHRDNMADLADTRTEDQKRWDRHWQANFDAMDRFFEEENYEIGRCHMCGLMNSNLNRCHCVEPYTDEHDHE